ncbi:MAG: hypothetical protein FJX35_19385 [Alphaproteobacteria bacterium]|nr:hypothetical protein [Alphaproteobacteria bacterium]
MRVAKLSADMHAFPALTIINSNTVQAAGFNFGVNNLGYLANNLDVAAAVTFGQFSSGLEHYLLFGWQEWRSLIAGLFNAR